ncbi:MAG: CBS domain-containing protein [Firmicutes bacterium]|uniref:CBS domain-containing protein n=1 Tax=Sulfobacillus benefaciens TaxID=453960 RepID=A0A2T2WX25_9FIRM|nr:CBS domain-containing protein [Bacillota bacterium]MCL5014023.1 CBS domain-containing protein [Bacillota bacterium]PSR26795.1 MAG: CBS domain-containing protein [Sulfobacillus benefaciens]HBQ93967.1 CBS domain-containing protein [Sulfobacillus sp.]
MRVSEIMTTQVKTVSPSDTIQKAAEIMKRIDCGSVPVMDNDRAVGMVTDRDITIHAIAEGKGADFPVKSCMTKSVVTVNAKTDAREAANIMADHQVRRLPVVENGKLVGILAMADLARVNIFVRESGQALKEISERTHTNSTVQH